MSQSNRIDVEVYPVNPGHDLEGLVDLEPLEFEDVHYVSFVSSPGGQGEGTYGIPAKLTDKDVKAEGMPVKVLYVNPANISAMLATRKA